MTRPAVPDRQPSEARTPASSSIAAATDGGAERRALDALLFQPSGWFAIDAANRKVPGVTPGTLDQALALVERGHVATVVGQLHPEVAGVDIDAGGALGDAAVDALHDWCATRGLWHLLRPSGGGPGRWHLLVASGVHAEDLAHFVDALRRELRLTTRHLGLRRQLRPLSAPHRRTGTVTPPAGLDEALAGLHAVLEPIPDRVRAQRAAQAPRVPRQRTGGPEEPLRPLPRPRRELPAPWAAYLTRGRTAAAAVDRDRATRSQLELEATTQLVIAGYSEPEAWAAVTGAHTSAFPKARSRGRRWWWHTWNRCVTDADAWLRSHRATTPATSPTAQRAATGHARTALEAAWRSWPARTRHTDLEVLTVVLDRMDRVGATSVAIPQRDLVLDCAVRSRTTVRGALARLQAAGLLQVDATYVPGTTDTAHTLRLPDALTSPTDAAHGSAVSPTDPSRYQPPHRRPALPLRRLFGLPVCTVLAHLPTPDASAGATPGGLARTAGLLDPDQDTPTPRQLRTIRSHLRALARHGLADVDEHGTWRASLSPAIPSPSQQSSTPPAAAAEEAGQRLDDAVHECVAAERAAFRERIDPQARRARWDHQRRTALARAATAASARQKTWWDSLHPDERERRRAALSAAFTALSPADQAHRKHALAVRRACAGEREPARYASWLEQLGPAALEQRSLDRALTFAARPAHQQQQLVAAWTDHRARWQLPHPQRSASRAPAPPPEVGLLDRSVPDVAELTLLDAASLTPPAPAAASA